MRRAGARAGRIDRPSLAPLARDRRSGRDDRGLPRHPARGAARTAITRHRGDAARPARLPDRRPSRWRPVAACARLRRRRHRRRGAAGRRARCSRTPQSARRRRPCAASGLGGNPKPACCSSFQYVGWPLGLPGSRLRPAGARLRRRARASRAKRHECRSAPSGCASSWRRGVCVQLTAASVDGRPRADGNAARRREPLLDAELAHLIASDAHAPAVRAIGMGSSQPDGRCGPCAAARWWLTHGRAGGAARRAEHLPPRPPARPKGRVRRPWRH